jgi:DNA-binding YbaB/EbfC family protein
VKNMNQLMKQAKKMQEEILRAQQELSQKVVEGTAGGGAVKVQLSGAKQMVGITIDKDVVNPDDVEMLQDLILAAFQDASARVDQMMEAELGKYTRGLNIPGLF